MPRENAVATRNAIAATTLLADIVVPGGTFPDGSVVFVVETIDCRSSSTTIDPFLMGGIAVRSSSGKCHEEHLTNGLS
jgi:hypothetical protein